MAKPDFRAFWSALPAVAELGGDAAVEFRRRYRQEIVAMFQMLRRVGLWGEATELHPAAPDQCAQCGIEFSTQSMFVDGATASGTWANMCASCFSESGEAIGWGTGPLYLNIGNGDWRLIAGGDPAARESEGMEEAA